MKKDQPTSTGEASHSTDSPCGCDRGGEFVDTGPVVGAFTPIPPGQRAGRIDHEVTTELQGVLGGAPEAGQTAATSDLDIVSKHPPAPHPANRTPSEAEGPVGASVVVHEDRERKIVDYLVVDQLSWSGEGDEDHFGGVAQLGEAIAHGDRMYRARESMDVAVEYQHHGAAAMVVQVPDVADRVGKAHVRCGRSDHRSHR